MASPRPLRRRSCVYCNPGLRRIQPATQREDLPGKIAQGVVVPIGLRPRRTAVGEKMRALDSKTHPVVFSCLSKNCVNSRRRNHFHSLALARVPHTPRLTSISVIYALNRRWLGLKLEKLLHAEFYAIGNFIYHRIPFPAAARVPRDYVPAAWCTN